MNGKKKNKYLIWHLIRMRAFQKQIRRRRKRRRYSSKLKTKSLQSTTSLGEILIPPSDFRLIENTKGCLEFFRDLRNENSIKRVGNTNRIEMSLKHVTHIDYGTISVLTAISDDLKYKRIGLKGDFPNDPECRQFIIDSGFLNRMYDRNNHPFAKSKKSELIFFESGTGKLSQCDNIKISNLVKNVVNHLTGKQEHCKIVRTIILEMCGNSIEWSGTENKQWLLGVKYEEKKVMFTVTDVGKGILGTLYRKFNKRITDAFFYKTDAEILQGAFEKKYGSATKEANRNRGLPSIKANFDNGNILNLKVLTNNVILHFNNSSLSRTFDKGEPRFKGTYYQWEMDANCIKRINRQLKHQL